MKPEVREHLLAERRNQGLPDLIEDPVVIERVVRILKARHDEAPGTNRRLITTLLSPTTASDQEAGHG